ncbi:MAG: DNA polymerase/3'-5' exonuclease PolX [Planctomycetaceae bacterium]
MNNDTIADAFDQVADLLEFQGANSFRIRAYRNGARTIRDYPQSLSSLASEGKSKLTEIDGIGDDLAQKICTLVQTGSLPMLVELKEQIPESVLALLRIPGMGPKKAAALYNQLGIKSLEELKTACDAGEVRKLKGFGAKTEQLILQGMAIAEQANQRILWADADAVAQNLAEHMRGCDAIEKMEFAGSYRRGKETIGDLDLLVVSSDVKAVMDQFDAFAGKASVTARGETKMSIRTDSGLQIDLRVVPQESFGAALQYFTGSKDHNVVLRGLAKDRGLKINEYGLFRVTDNGEEYIAGKTEEEIYHYLKLPLFPPEIRESRQEYEWAKSGELPTLVEESDIQGDLHMHTHATDGSGSIEEMVAAAQKRGLSYIAITDHSQRVSMARGLDPARLLAQWEEIDRLRPTLPKGFTLLKGIECDILEAGGMDLPDDVLAQADWVLASVHYGQKQSREQITERILGAIENTYVSCVAHPTGRLLNRREPYEVDLDAVFAACKKHGKLLELNANPWRLDLNDVYCAAAKQHGIPIVVNTDAHSVDGLNVLRYGILQARRGGLTKEDVANTRSWAQMKKLIGKH